MAERSACQSLPPERVLQDFNSDLYDAIRSPERLAQYMLTERFITSDLIDNLPTLSFDDKRSKLLGAFRIYLKASSQKMQMMTKIYRSLERTEESLLKDLVSRMRALCPGEDLSDDVSSVPSVVHVDQGTQVQLYDSGTSGLESEDDVQSRKRKRTRSVSAESESLPPSKSSAGATVCTLEVKGEVVTSLLQLQCEFVNMINEVEVMFIKNIQGDYFIRFRRNLVIFYGEKFKQCLDVPGVFDLWVDELSIFNVQALREISQVHNVTGALKLIMEYMNKCSTFKSSTTIQDFKKAVEGKLVPPCPEGKQQLMLRLGVGCVPRTLKDLKCLLYDVFGVHYNVLIDRWVMPGSIVFCWLVPDSVAPILMMKAALKRKLLSDKGVEELSLSVYEDATMGSHKEKLSSTEFVEGDPIKEVVSLKKELFALEGEITTLKTNTQRLQEELASTQKINTDYSEQLERELTILKTKTLRLQEELDTTKKMKAKVSKELEYTKAQLLSTRQKDDDVPMKEPAALQEQLPSREEIKSVLVEKVGSSSPQPQSTSKTGHAMEETFISGGSEGSLSTESVDEDDLSEGSGHSQLKACIPASKALPTQSHDHMSSAVAGISAQIPSDSTPSVLIESYVSFLKSSYRSRFFPTYFKPDISHKAKSFINLALVHRERETHRRREEAIMYQVLGKIDEICRRKAPLELSDIGWISRYDGEEEKMVRHLSQEILIEGAPGVGKTTLAWHLCRTWEKGELFQQWPVVVMLQLRDIRIRQAQTLSDLFYHPTPEVRQAVVSQIEEKKGSGLLLIFEGYDELSPDQLSEDSIFVQLLKRKVIPEVAIMVTSQPLATSRLPDEFKQSAGLQHVEVLGFRRQDINEYVTAACGDKQDILKAFQSYLSCHPFIYSAMYNPLHCALISQLYIMHWEKGKKEFAPRTLTELYEYLTFFFLQRYLSDHPVYGAQYLKFGQFSELPIEVYQQLMDVGRLAADGIERREYIFDSVSIESMGFLCKVEDMYIGQGHLSSHSFLHLTFQEFLAAWYWSHTLFSQQLKELVSRPDLFPLEQFLQGKHRDEDRSSTSTMTHWPVLLFIAGLTKSTFGLKVEGATTYPGHSVRPYLCQYLFECQSTQSVSSVLTGGRYRIIQSSMGSSLDWFVAGYFIAHSSAACLWNVRVGTLHQTKMLAKGLNYTVESEKERRISLAEGQTSIPPKKAGGRIVCLDISNPSDIMYILSPYTQHLTQLTFRGKLPKTPVSFFNGISIHYPMLEDLDVHCIVKYDELLCLVNVFSKLGNFAKLKLTFTPELLQDAKSVSVLGSLQSYSFFTEVCCKGTGGVVTSSSIKALLINKFKAITLESMDLLFSAAEAVSRSLQSQHCVLVTLTFRSCCLATRYKFEQLAIGIGRNTSLSRVVFHNCDLGSADVIVLADALRDNKTLKSVVISKPRTGLVIDEVAIQALKQCNQNIAFEVSLD